MRWLQADIQSPEIEVRFTPNNGHSEAHAGLPLMTHSGHLVECLLLYYELGIASACPAYRSPLFPQNAVAKARIEYRQYDIGKQIQSDYRRR